MAEDVYLIFSANKSGEYFGYARMNSAIDGETASSIEAPTRPEPGPPTTSDIVPTTVLTPATKTAPKGHIIEDSIRGTIFWEAETVREAAEQRSEEHGMQGAEQAESEAASPTTPQVFGKPFKITWISTDRLPFYRTRGLRNPWNANREVKIARDGTELEPSVGNRLINMFHRPQPLASAGPASGMAPFAPGMSYVSHPGPLQPY